MAISLVTSGTGSGSAANGGNVTLTLPTLAQNDVVYVLVGAHVPAMSTAGYTPVATATAPGLKCIATLYRKKMGGSPDTQAVINGGGNTNDSVTGEFICLRGVDTTTQEDATATTATGTSTNPDAPSITTVTNGAWVIACAAADVLDASVTAPSGYSNHVTASQTDTNAATSALATNTVSVAGAEDPPSWTTWSSGNWAALTVAVRPAPVAAALAATPTAVSTVTAALTTAILCAASATSASTATASLTTGIRLNATPAAASTATAGLTTSIRLAATPTATSTATAALTTASGFAATATAQSTVTAALTTSIRLNATPSAASTASAALGTSIRLAAASTSVSAATAALSTAIRLNATLAAASSATAALTTRIELNAVAVAQSTASARIYVYSPSMMLAMFG